MSTLAGRCAPITATTLPRDHSLLQGCTLISSSSPECCNASSLLIARLRGLSAQLTDSTARPYCARAGGRPPLNRLRASAWRVPTELLLAEPSARSTPQQPPPPHPGSARWQCGRRWCLGVPLRPARLVPGTWCPVLGLTSQVHDVSAGLSRDPRCSASLAPGGFLTVTFAVEMSSSTIAKNAGDRSSWQTLLLRLILSSVASS